MLYKQDIANLALGHLGVSHRVMDLETENTQQARIIRSHFRTALDTMLSRYEWGFATQFQALALQEESPVAAYKYAYALPADCAVPRVVAEDGHFPLVRQYEREKSKFRHVFNGSGQQIIYTNVPRAHLEYTTRLSEEIAFPPHFARGLSHLLALDIAPSLITNNFPKIKDSLIGTSRVEVSEAIAIDLSMEPQLEDSPTPFISARRF